MMVSNNIGKVVFNNKTYGKVYKGNKTVLETEKYKFIDMGLSVDWSTFNIGAKTPEEEGWFFKWGGISRYTKYLYFVNDDGTQSKTQSSFSWSSYPHANGSSVMTKYCTDESYGTVDNKTVLDPEDDAACVYASNGARMPTIEEFQELDDACDKKYGKYNNVYGYIFTLKSDPSKQLFFPITGYLSGSQRQDWSSAGMYWSSSLSSTNTRYANTFYFKHPGDNNGGPYYRLTTNMRYYACPVRAVKKTRELITGNDGIRYYFVDLGLPSGNLWATANIGSTSEEEYGWYFQWAGTIPYAEDCTPVGGGDPIVFGYNTDCPYYVSGGTGNDKSGNDTVWSKYTTLDRKSDTGKKDGKYTLESEDDAACVHIGGGARMPTKKEYEELLNACDEEWVTDYKGTGVNGKLLTLKSNPKKTLFFPGNGNLRGTSVYPKNYDAYYWTSTIYDYYAAGATASAYYCWFSNSSFSSMNNVQRYCAQPVRAVLPKA